MSQETPGTVMAISKNKAALAVSNDYGWTVVELIGSEGEIRAGDIVSGDWEAVGSQHVTLIRKKYSAIFRGTGTEQWARGQINQWGC
jgi:hypothetical protein